MVAPHVPTVHRSATVDLPVDVETAWARLGEPRWDRWVDGTIAVLDPSGDAALGTTYGERNAVLGPWRTRTTWVVTTFDPPRMQRHEGEGLPFVQGFSVEFRVEPTVAGSRFTMTYRCRPAGPLGRIAVALAMGRRLQRSVDRSVAAFGRLVAE